ncbi:MAG: hypothetical protein Q4G00_15410, partial [Clostridia bacterium]|nr:hypothetical protein [Clostridia bacterium]
RLKAAKPDALHPVKIGEIGLGKSRLNERCIIPSSHWLPGINQVVTGGLSPAQFCLFSLCPKACYIPSPAHHAEAAGFYLPCSFAKCFFVTFFSEESKRPPFPPNPNLHEAICFDS